MRRQVPEQPQGGKAKRQSGWDLKSRVRTWFLITIFPRGRWGLTQSQTHGGFMLSREKDLNRADGDGDKPRELSPLSFSPLSFSAPCILAHVPLLNHPQYPLLSCSHFVYLGIVSHWLHQTWSQGSRCAGPKPSSASSEWKEVPGPQQTAKLYGVCGNHTPVSTCLPGALTLVFLSVFYICCF